MTPLSEEDIVRFAAAQAPTDADIAAAVLVMQNDPFDRFLKALTDPYVKANVLETVELRREFQHHATSMLVATDPREATKHAGWVASHAVEVAYRWALLRDQVAYFAARDFSPITILVPR